MNIHLILEAWKLIQREVQFGNVECGPKCIISWFGLWNIIVELWYLLWQHENELYYVVKFCVIWTW